MHLLEQQRGKKIANLLIGDSSLNECAMVFGSLSKR
jgi:hypothetical protein